MNCFDVCLAVSIALLPSVVTAEDAVPAIISAWHEATADTVAVRASFHLIRYDKTFNVQMHATGTFGYLSPHHGFWQITNYPAEHQKRRVAPSGIQYEVQPFHDEHFRWHGNRFRDINDKDKSFSEGALDQSTNAVLSIFTSDLFRTVDWETPFLPGRPNKGVAAEWTYLVTKESDSHTWVRATPQPGTPLQNRMASCDLIFQRDPVRLVATRSTCVAGNQQTVTIYSDVQIDPEPWSEPDLSEYTQTNSPVQRAKSP